MPNYEEFYLEEDQMRYLLMIVTSYRDSIQDGMKNCKEYVISETVDKAILNRGIYESNKIIKAIKKALDVD